MIKCPHCEQQNPVVAVTREDNLTISGESEISAMTQKAVVEVECNHCGNRFAIQFELQPAGIMIDLS